MKRIAGTIGFFIFIMNVNAQIIDPVTWEIESKKIADKTYEVHLKAAIQPPWHLYSQFTPSGGPVATEFNYSNNPLVILSGVVKELGKLERHYEPLFGVDVKQFSDKVDFVQVIKLKANIKTNVVGTIKYMTCNDRECLPPKTIPFTIAIK